MWNKDRKALPQRSAGGNALKSVIVLKCTYSDSTVNKFIYSYMKGGWEHQCFRYASYIKGPLISYYLKKQEGTRKICLSTVEIYSSFCSSHCYDIKCNIWKYIRRTEESFCSSFLSFSYSIRQLLPLSVCLSKNWERGERDTFTKGKFLPVSWTTDHTPSPLKA